MDNRLALKGNMYVWLFTILQTKGSVFSSSERDCESFVSFTFSQRRSLRQNLMRKTIDQQAKYSLSGLLAT
jgi:hypothetical protein